MLECSGELQSDQVQECTYFTSDSESDIVDDDIELILVVMVIVIVVVIILVVVVILHWKRKEMMAFAKEHCVAQCR